MYRSCGCSIPTGQFTHLPGRTFRGVLVDGVVRQVEHLRSQRDVEISSLPILVQLPRFTSQEGEPSRFHRGEITNNQPTIRVLRPEDLTQIASQVIVAPLNIGVVDGLHVSDRGEPLEILHLHTDPAGAESLACATVHVLIPEPTILAGECEDLGDLAEAGTTQLLMHLQHLVHLCVLSRLSGFQLGVLHLPVERGQVLLHMHLIEGHCLDTAILAEGFLLLVTTEVQWLFPWFGEVRMELVKQVFLVLLVPLGDLLDQRDVNEPSLPVHPVGRGVVNVLARSALIPVPSGNHCGDLGVPDVVLCEGLPIGVVLHGLCSRWSWAHGELPNQPSTLVKFPNPRRK